MTYKQYLRRTRRSRRVRGSRGWRRLFRPNHCVGGDCLCPIHEGVVDHMMSRAVSKRAARAEIREQLG